MNKHILFYFLISLFSLSIVKGQTFVKGEILLQLSPTSSIQDFEINLKKAQIPLRLKSTILPEKKIYLYAFDENNISNEELLKKVKTIPNCLKAQNNHYIEHRTIPNDPLYPNQWQYNNSGNNGGVVNADIDADLAWDITTGGNTALGDTIVICIIDDGIDTLHEDLKSNLWKNIHEIPNNGIDDDNNGYIDDIYGWNTLNNDNNISGGGHGTPIAAIIGAVGNNNIGVAGVNWKIKLMIIKGGGTEAQALAAYAYPWKMRKLYNETAGQYGAFIVATNTSWGIDNLKAIDAPIWCDFYDTLGEEGILNIAATSNINVNVDIVGDMPTTCTSPYLLSVTNLKKDDIKETTAGYGAQSIDIGAYGTAIYTALNNNSYGTFGGTSSATPHVSGVVGLIYAIPCLGFALDAKNTPANIALHVKDFILQGGTNNTSLQNITTTGKRLNAFGALQNALNYDCFLPNCHAPFQIEIDFNMDNSFHINWARGNNNTLYEIRFGLDSNNLQTFTTNDTFFQINNVIPCQTYILQLGNVCSLDNTYYRSQYFYITSQNCCHAPNLLQNLTTTENNISFEWGNATDINDFVIFFKREYDIVWDSLILNDTFINLSNLENCTNYEIQLKSRCPNNNLENLSQIFTISTKGCGTCIDENYCTMKGENNNYEWITNISINNFSHSSGKSTNGYSNEGLYLATPTIDLRYPVTFSFTLDENLSTENWQWGVWIDLNRDGIFNQSTELIYNSGIVNTTTISGNLNIPRLGILGNTRMRIAMRWGSTALNVCEDFPYGEVEDYCIILDDILSVEQFSEPTENIHIFPNPFAENINIVFDETLKLDKFNLYLHDILGREIYNEVLNAQNINYQINTSFLEKGTYIISLVSEKGIILSKKIIK